MDRAVIAWEPTLAAETGTVPAVSRRNTWGGHAVAAMRTTVLLVLASLAILVLLPAAIAAQAMFAG